MTRGFGLLEPALARLRARKANALIPPGHRQARILDVGCGSYPCFLSHTSFAEKFAVDQVADPGPLAGITWHTLDLNSFPTQPFEDGFFSVVTLLAVVEHVDPGSLAELFKESRRVLGPDGIVILTTPAAWSDRLLHFMAGIALVSQEEIDEHVYAYTLPLIGWYFGKAGFSIEKLRFGSFELGLNPWATAER